MPSKDSDQKRLLELGIRSRLQRPLHWRQNCCICFCVMSPLTGISGNDSHLTRPFHNLFLSHEVSELQKSQGGFHVRTPALQGCMALALCTEVQLCLFGAGYLPAYSPLVSAWHSVSYPLRFRSRAACISGLSCWAGRQGLLLVGALDGPTFLVRQD